MAAYTQISRAELEALLSGFDFGDLTDFSAISAGIENSNYTVRTQRTDLVLTLFEHHNAAEVGEFVRLGRHLRERQRAREQPRVDGNGLIKRDAVIVDAERHLHHLLQLGC